jgi:hypothetical protein
MCGSQRCYGDDESISTCGRYEGDIEGIEKKESLRELLDKINASRPEGVININVEGDNNGEINGIKQTYNK